MTWLLWLLLLQPTNPYDNGFSGNYKDSAIYDPSFLLPFLGYHLRPGGWVCVCGTVESESGERWHAGFA